MGDMVTVEDPRVTCTNGRDQKSWMEMDETTAGVLAEPHQEYLTVGGQWTQVHSSYIWEGSLP